MQQTPLIGILTSDGARMFRGNHQNFVDLIQMGRKLGVLICVLTPRSFGSSDQFVQGYVLRSRSSKPRWSKERLPFPRVIYNRIPNRVVEQRAEEQAVLKRILDMPHVQLFNTGFFNKWHLYQLLYTHEDWRYMIPATKPLNHIDTLKTMLKQHATLFAKPINGKAGIGLMKITQRDHQYLLTYQDKQGQKHHRFQKVEPLWKQIQYYTQKKAYVLQKGITLAKYRNQPCDFRVLVQKDKLGTWQLTGVGVRVAGKQAISTHVPMGGYIANVHEVLKKLFPHNHDYIYQKIGQKTKGIARFIEESRPTPLGEMSMDIGIEPSGRMWFFEANAKPMKFDEPSIRSLSLKRIVEYAHYLSKSTSGIGVKQS